MKELARRMNERISSLSESAYQAWKYALIGLVVYQLDVCHCSYLNQFYGTSDYFFTHMRGWLAISVSLLFGIVDIFIARKVIKYANGIHFHFDIIMTNGIPSQIKIEGKTRLLKYVAEYYWLISIISVIYDLYEIVFVHLLE